MTLDPERAGYELIGSGDSSFVLRYNGEDILEFDDMPLYIGVYPRTDLFDSAFHYMSMEKVKLS